jgi:predicted transcriptional regulator of viral defense system
MKKSKSIAKKSMSKQEFAALEAIGQSGIVVFGITDMQKLTGMRVTRCYQLISQMKRKGLISEVESGKYVVTVPSRPDLLVIASHIVSPSYISFWTALSFHGFTEQLPNTLFVVTVKRKRAIMYEGARIKFVTLSPSRLFGYIRTEGGAVIADKEKSVVDSLLLPRYAGGMLEFAKCLSNAWREVDQKKLIDYALRMSNGSLIRRLGYTLQELGLPVKKELMDSLRDKIGSGYSLFDPLGPKGGIYDRRWMLRINSQIKSSEGII